MVEAKQPAAYAVQVELLPVWWRCVLVAVATLILCSCTSPAMRTHLSADKSLLDSGQVRAHERSQPPALPGGSATRHVERGPQHSEPPAEPGANCVCEGGALGYARYGAIATDPYGPLLGPSDEYLCDGGDYGTPAGVTADRTVVGLEPEDAVSHY